MYYPGTIYNFESRCKRAVTIEELEEYATEYSSYTPLNIHIDTKCKKELNRVHYILTGEPGEY